MVYISASPVKLAAYILLSLQGVYAFWRLECDGSVGLARIDPLMDYGRVADHVHSIKGGSGKTLVSFSWYKYHSSLKDCCHLQTNIDAFIKFTWS